ncbi:hypothetical protein Y032_0017g3375 [Ancylostoma ceylanicum]|nr:hypothetical protein Y032_0017g3375 [Ancylostoma ceylanicum]
MENSFIVPLLLVTTTSRTLNLAACARLVRLLLAYATASRSSLSRVLLVLSALKNLCSILQSVFTTPSLHSSLIRTAMRTLPERISPARDPVTMWSREEVLERYRIRKDKGWEKRAVHRKLERDYQGDIYPWTSAFEHYLSNYERARLRTRWTRTYAELRINSENATKAGIISAISVGELHKWHTFERFHLIQDQLGWWFKRWIIEIYQKDPRKDKIETCRNNSQEKLKRLLCSHFGALEELSIAKPNISMGFVLESQYHVSCFA